MSNIQVITDDIYGARDSFVAVVSDKDISFEREAGFAIQSVASKDYTLSVAMKNRQSGVCAGR